VTLDDIPPADIPDSITPEYVYRPQTRHTLAEFEREKMVHEVRARGSLCRHETDV